MSWTLPDLIDIPNLRMLMERFHAATGIPAGIIGRDGELLVATGWRELCTSLHRSHPVTAQRCRQCDDRIKASLSAEDYVTYKCRNGLWDMAMPIMIAGEHCATLFLGQFFYEDEEIDEAFFLAQALEFGFDTDRYMAALRRIPVFSRNKVQQIMDFYTQFVDFLVKTGLANRRQMEMGKMLQESEQRYREIFYNTSDCIFLLEVTSDGRFKFAGLNPAEEKTVGLSSTEVSGRFIEDVVPEEIAKGPISHYRHCMETGTLINYDEELDLPVGHRHFHTSLIPLHDAGRIYRIIGIARDITERKRAENALLESKRLLESEKRFRSLFEHMLDGVAYCRMLYDDNGCPADFVYLDVNNAFSELTGLHDVIGKKVSEVLPGIKESSPELFEVYGRVALTGRPEKFEIYIKQLSLWRSMSVYSTEKGHFVAVFENITERKRVEAELRESHFKLRELTAHLNLRRERERKAFARKVHDELGTSLTLLKFDLAWLKRNYPPDEKTVAERIRAMDELIHECTKTIQRITSELRPSLLDEQGLAATIEWQAKEFEKRTGISCRLEIDTATAPLSQDKAINVFRIFQESLSNVMRHACATSVVISLVKDGQHIVLRITDNGVGISDQEISSARSFGILGMEERARLCGGEFTIKGIPGKGTTISVSVPT